MLLFCHSRAFNDWPMYAERWFPEGAFELEPWFRNLTENSGLVQFNHRMLAYASIFSVAATFLAARNPILWLALPAATRKLVLALVAVVAAQVRGFADRRSPQSGHDMSMLNQRCLILL